MIEGFKQENREKLPVERLETYLVFVRHGKAEKIEGSDTNEPLDATRRLTVEGDAQVYAAGKSFAEELQLQPNDVIFKRSSLRIRAKQTVEEVVQGFLDGQRDKGIENANVQKSNRSARPEFGFPAKTANAYATGVERKGTTQGLCEEWVRHPEIYQKDLVKTGLDEDAIAELLEMKDSFQNIVALMERAGKVLLKRWDKTEKNDGAVAPRLIVFAGGHGFVSEPWLKEVVSDFEVKTNRQIPIELGYGKYFTLHFSTNPDEPVILNIGGEKIPVEEKFIRAIRK